MFTCRNCDANPIIVTRKGNNQHSGIIPLSPQPSFSTMEIKHFSYCEDKFYLLKKNETPEVTKSLF